MERRIITISGLPKLREPLNVNILIPPGRSGDLKVAVNVPNDIIERENRIENISSDQITPNGVVLASPPVKDISLSGRNIFLQKALYMEDSNLKLSPETRNVINSVGSSNSSIDIDSFEMMNPSPEMKNQKDYHIVVTWEDQNDQETIFWEGILDDTAGSSIENQYIRIYNAGDKIQFYVSTLINIMNNRTFLKFYVRFPTDVKLSQRDENKMSQLVPDVRLLTGPITVRDNDGSPKTLDWARMANVIIISSYTKNINDKYMFDLDISSRSENINPPNKYLDNSTFNLPRITMPSSFSGRPISPDDSLYRPPNSGVSVNSNNLTTTYTPASAPPRSPPIGSSFLDNTSPFANTSLTTHMSPGESPTLHGELSNLSLNTSQTKSSTPFQSVKPNASSSLSSLLQTSSRNMSSPRVNTFYNM